MRYLLLAMTLLLASPALAGAWSKTCQFSGGNLTGTVGASLNTDGRVNTGNLGCYRFVVGDSTHNSPIITIAAETAVIAFDPRLDAAVTARGTPLVVPHLCLAGSILTAANPEQSCITIGGANGNADLDGLEGASSTQNAAIRVGPGIYYFQITGACEAGDTCQVSVKGEAGP